jgi:hypothetical protein
VPDLLAAGGVRVALGDVTGDGVPDTIAGTGPTVPNVVLIYDGKTGEEIHRLVPFEAAFVGGIYVAAGDVNRDGFDDIIVGAGETGGARVRVFSGKDRSTLADYFAIDDVNFRGGVRVAAGDINGDRYPDVVAAAGERGGPRIALWDGYYLRPDRTPRKLTGDFFAFEPSVRNGSFVAAGDLDGDGIAEVIAGAGPGGGPRVVAFDGRGLGREGVVQPVASFFAFDPSDRRGVRVAIKEFDGDGKADLLTGSGTRPVVATFSGASVLVTDSPDPLSELDVLSGFNGGVFVA